MKFLVALITLLTILSSRSGAAENELDISRGVDPSKLIPLSMSGYSGEALSVLRFDLEVAGFNLTSAEAAQYILQGKNDGQVEGILTDRISKAILVRKAFSGAATRMLAHALADEVCLAVFHKPGIARTKIAYKAEKGGHSEIYVSDYDGYNPTQITTDGTIVAAPAWAPGKRLLYYTSYKSGAPDIYSHDLVSGERRPFARYSGLNTSAAVAPDGRVAMILSKSGSPDLYVCNADGTGLTRLTTTLRDDESSPCWSPDGSQICFVSNPGTRIGLFVISSRGGSARRLQTSGVGRPTEPDWSPDGKTIVFTSQYGGARGGFQICTIPAGGGEAAVLTDGEDPSWAPNSRTVIFTRRHNNKRTLSLLDVPSKRVKDVAQSSGSCAQPAWAK
jgi:TolB protein